MNEISCRIGRVAASLVITCAVLAGAHDAQAQNRYPDRPLRLIVPFPPGGQTDNVSRRLDTALTPILGQQLVIDNRAGASGTIGSAEAARAKPDGYTLLMATASTHAIMPTVMSKIPYDTLKDRSFIETLVRLGVDPVTDSNPDKAAAMLKAELDRWRPLIESMGLKQ